MGRGVVDEHSQITVINIVKDGGVCDDMEKYFQTHDLPELTMQILYGMVDRTMERLRKQHMQSKPAAEQTK